MSHTVFSKIISGEIPCHKIYEDDKTLAFLDIHPKTPGHVLVVPKIEVDVLWDLDSKEYQAVMATAQKVANRIQGVLEPMRVGMMVEGIGVPHAHVHVFPFDNADEYFARPDMDAEPDHDRLAEIAKKLAF